MVSGDARSAPFVRRFSALGLKVAAAAVALSVVIPVSIAGVYAESRPVTALRWSPVNAEAKSIWASQALRADKSGAEAHAEAMARDALRRDATTVDAWRTLAEVADREGDEPLARRLYNLVERLSRRDQPTHFWLANDLLRQGKVAASVEQLDLALRTSESNWDRFLPMMVAATADPQVIEPLRRRLASAPNWRDPFMARMVASAPNLANAAKIARDLSWRVPAQRVWIETLLQRIADSGDYDLAWQFYAHARELAMSRPPAGIVDGDFEGSGQYPFGWGLVDEEHLSGRPGARPGGEGNSLLLSASDDRSGAVARQLLALPAGTYRLSARIGASEGNAQLPTITLTCAKGGSPLTALRGSQATGAVEGKTFTANFSVPADCRWQWIALEISASGADGEVTGWADDVAVRALGRTGTR